MDAIEAIKTRRSIRAYEEKPVPKHILEDLIDCARLAPSGVNVQPCEFVVITDAETRRKIADITDYGKFIAQAGACILVCAKPTKYYLEDGSAATENILVAARAHGLGSCWVAGAKKTYTRKILDLVGAPSDYLLVSIIAVGYPAEERTPHKRPLEEVIHWEKF